MIATKLIEKKKKMTTEQVRYAAIISNATKYSNHY